MISEAINKTSAYTPKSVLKILNAIFMLGFRGMQIAKPKILFLTANLLNHLWEL
jgi:hypothetical protein